MKKSIIIIALIASIGGMATAQDTIWKRPFPKDNYFYNNWIDTNGTNYYGSYGGVEMSLGPYEEITKQFVTEDTLRVYGIAAMMVNHYFMAEALNGPERVQAALLEEYPEDPTFNNCAEWLQLFQYTGGDTAQMQQLGDSMYVHNLNTPVTYYMLSNHLPIISYLDTVPKPVYERYFSEPQTVHDTFFVGYTQSHWAVRRTDSTWYRKRPSFFALAFDHTNLLAVYRDYNVDLAAQWRDTSGHTWWRFIRERVGADIFIFPILTPPDTSHTADTVVGGGDTIVVGLDTIIGGSDTVAYGDTLVVSDTLVVNGDTIVVHDTLLTIVPGDLLQRLTGVQPNPAANVARVVSSAGITALDAYTLDGRRVHTQCLDGAPLTATIDVSRWPAGTYLLRIRTPMGTALKKLTVTR